MSRHSLITIKHSRSPKGTNDSCHPSQMSVHLNSHQNCEKSLGGSLASTRSDDIRTQLLNSSSFHEDLSLGLHKSNLESYPGSNYSSVGHPQYSEHVHSQSSTFCTSLFSSSSINSDSCRKLSQLPFLPHPPKCEQQNSAVLSSNSPLLFSGDINVACGEDEHTDDMVKDFLNLPGDASDGNFQRDNYGSDGLPLNEQIELQLLSEQLGIAITDNGESPCLDVGILFILHSFLFTKKDVKMNLLFHSSKVTIASSA